MNTTPAKIEEFGEYFIGGFVGHDSASPTKKIELKKRLLFLMMDLGAKESDIRERLREINSSDNSRVTASKIISVFRLLVAYPSTASFDGTMADAGRFREYLKEFSRHLCDKTYVKVLPTTMVIESSKTANCRKGTAMASGKSAGLSEDIDTMTRALHAHDVGGFTNACERAVTRAENEPSTLLEALLFLEDSRKMLLKLKTRSDDQWSSAMYKCLDNNTNRLIENNAVVHEWLTGTLLEGGSIESAKNIFSLHSYFGDYNITKRFILRFLVEDKNIGVDLEDCIVELFVDNGDGEILMCIGSQKYTEWFPVSFVKLHSHFIARKGKSNWGNVQAVADTLSDNVSLEQLEKFVAEVVSTHLDVWKTTKAVIPLPTVATVEYSRLFRAMYYLWICVGLGKCLRSLVVSYKNNNNWHALTDLSIWVYSNLNEDVIPRRDVEEMRLVGVLLVRASSDAYEEVGHMGTVLKLFKYVSHGDSLPYDWFWDLATQYGNVNFKLLHTIFRERYGDATANACVTKYIQRIIASQKFSAVLKIIDQLSGVYVVPAELSEMIKTEANAYMGSPSRDVIVAREASNLMLALNKDDNPPVVAMTTMTTTTTTTTHASGEKDAALADAIARADIGAFNRTLELRLAGSNMSSSLDDLVSLEKMYNLAHNKIISSAARIGASGVATKMAIQLQKKMDAIKVKAFEWLSHSFFVGETRQAIVAHAISVFEKNDNFDLCQLTKGWLFKSISAHKHALVDTEELLIVLFIDRGSRQKVSWMTVDGAISKLPITYVKLLAKIMQTWGGNVPCMIAISRIVNANVSLENLEMFVNKVIVPYLDVWISKPEVSFALPLLRTTKYSRLFDVLLPIEKVIGMPKGFDLLVAHCNKDAKAMEALLDWTVVAMKSGRISREDVKNSILLGMALFRASSPDGRDIVATLSIVFDICTRTEAGDEPESAEWIASRASEFFDLGHIYGRVDYSLEYRIFSSRYRQEVAAKIVTKFVRQAFDIGQYSTVTSLLHDLRGSYTLPARYCDEMIAKISDNQDPSAKELVGRLRQMHSETSTEGPITGVKRSGFTSGLAAPLSQDKYVSFEKRVTILCSSRSKMDDEQFRWYAEKLCRENGHVYMDTYVVACCRKKEFAPVKAMFSALAGIYTIPANVALAIEESGEKLVVPEKTPSTQISARVVRAGQTKGMSIQSVVDIVQSVYGRVYPGYKDRLLEVIRNLDTIFERGAYSQDFEAFYHHYMTNPSSKLEPDLVLPFLIIWESAIESKGYTLSIDEHSNPTSDFLREFFIRSLLGDQQFSRWIANYFLDSNSQEFDHMTARAVSIMKIFGYLNDSPFVKLVLFIAVGHSFYTFIPLVDAYREMIASIFIANDPSGTWISRLYIDQAHMDDFYMENAMMDNIYICQLDILNAWETMAPFGLLAHRIVAYIDAGRRLPVLAQNYIVPILQTYPYFVRTNEFGAVMRRFVSEMVQSEESFESVNDNCQLHYYLRASNDRRMNELARIIFTALGQPMEEHSQEQLNEFYMDEMERTFTISRKTRDIIRMSSVIQSLFVEVGFPAHEIIAASAAYMLHMAGEGKFELVRYFIIDVLVGLGDIPPEYFTQHLIPVITDEMTHTTDEAVLSEGTKLVRYIQEYLAMAYISQINISQ